jgi:hypothetical protein
MQTVEENKTNYLVFPYEEFTDTLPSGSKIYALFAYQTMQNDSSSYQFVSSSIIENDRWSTVPTKIITSGTPLVDELKLIAGTTYEIQLRYALKPIPFTWSTVQGTWSGIQLKWGYQSIVGYDSSILLQQDRLFVSGAVSPNEKVYISSNEDAVLRIYQG